MAPTEPLCRQPTEGRGRRNCCPVVLARHQRHSRRRALLLEVLIAMALLSLGLGVLFRGPVLLVQAEAKALQLITLEWEIDRQFLHQMAQLVEGGAAALRAEPLGIEVPVAGQAPLRAVIEWSLYEEVESSRPAVQPPPGHYFRLMAKVSWKNQQIQRQRALFLEGP